MKKEGKLEFGLKDALIPFNSFRKKWMNDMNLEGSNGRILLEFNGGFSLIGAGLLLVYASLSFSGGTFAFTNKWYENWAKKGEELQAKRLEPFYEYDTSPRDSVWNAEEFLNYQNKENLGI